MSESLRDAELLAADAIGDVIEHWGFRKPLGRLWAMLYLDPTPLSATDLAERLAMSAGGVSTSLSELQRWGVVRRVWRPGERKEFFEAETDFWKMISKVVSEREKFLANSVRRRLTDAADMAHAVAKDAGAKAMPRAKHFEARVRKLLAFAEVAEAVLDSFIASQRVDFQRFGNLLSLTKARAGRAS
jgi:HTH-type transcriptional regulator, glycine betaine synthesis regulator